MGFGVSSLVFGSVANVLFGIMDWTLVFMIIALAAFGVMFLLAFVIESAPEDIDAQLGLTHASASAPLSPLQQTFIMKTKVFWLFWIWAILIVACGLTLIGTSAQGANVLKLDDTIFVGFAAILVGLVSTMNGISRIVNGILFDKVGLVPIMLYSSVVCFLCALGLSVSLAWGIGPLYIVAAIFIALPYGASPVMCAAFARQRFKPRDFSMNLGILACSIAVAATINIIIVALLGSPTEANGPLIYGILAVFSVLAFLTTLVFNRLYKADLAIIDKERG